MAKYGGASIPSKGKCTFCHRPLSPYSRREERDGICTACRGMRAAYAHPQLGKKPETDLGDGLDMIAGFTARPNLGELYHKLYASQRLAAAWEKKTVLARKKISHWKTKRNRAAGHRQRYPDSKTALASHDNAVKHLLEWQTKAVKATKAMERYRNDYRIAFQAIHGQPPDKLNAKHPF